MRRNLVLRRVFVLSCAALALFSSAVGLPAGAERGGARLDHLEDRAHALRGDVAFLEDALAVNAPLQGPSRASVRPAEFRRTTSSSPAEARTRRLERRLGQLDRRVTALEDVVFGGSSRLARRDGHAAQVDRVGRVRHGNRGTMPLWKLAGWTTRLERRVRSLQEAVITVPPPTPPPPSTSPSPSATPSPTTPPPPSPSPTQDPGPEGSSGEQCQGVELSPGVDIHAKVAAKPESTTFCLSPGVYRISRPLVLKAGQELIGTGSRDAIISGAKVITPSREGSYWVITGQTSLGQSRFGGTTDQCRPVEGVDPKGMCVYRDQVFLNDVSLWQVGSLGELSAGEFFWDYATNKIYLVDDPTGKKVELSVAGAGISGGSGVEIKNLVVEKFGNPVQGGAISASNNWLIQGVESRLNHGGGVRMGPGTILRDSYIHHNGELGIAGGQATCSRAKGLIVENNEISYNNTAGYNWGWEAGGSKWTYTDGLIVRNNFVHNNYGNGLWTDVDNINTLFEDNRVEDNYGSGIIHEIGYAAVIRDNIVRRNGFQHPVQGNVWGSGIHVDMSRDVEIYGNTVENNAAGITAVQTPAGDQCGYGLQEVVNLYVHDNTVRQLNGIASGLNLYLESDQSYYTSRNNRWEDNTYYLGDPNGLSFYWAGVKMNAAAWRSYGQD